MIFKSVVVVLLLINLLVTGTVLYVGYQVKTNVDRKITSINNSANSANDAVQDIKTKLDRLPF